MVTSFSPKYWCKCDTSTRFPPHKHCKYKTIPISGTRNNYESNQLGVLLNMNGGISFIPLYWEWLEHVLSQCKGLLNDANHSEAIFAPLFTYDYNEHLVKAFCECWSPMTNILLLILLCNEEHFIKKKSSNWKPTKLMQIPHCNRNFSNQSMQSICHWTPTFTKRFHKIFIVIIHEQGSENNFTKVGIIKESLASNEYIFQPFPI